MFDDEDLGERTFNNWYSTLRVPRFNYVPRFGNIVVEEMDSNTFIAKEKEVNEMNGDNVETRTYTDFKIGDLVKIRNWDVMLKQYGSIRDEITLDNQGNRLDKTDYNYLKDDNYIINSVYHGSRYIEIAIESVNIKNIKRWTAVPQMLEIIEENFVGKRKEEAEKMRKENELKIKETETETIIQEMISKVDMQKVKRILAGSYNIPQTALKGVEKLINQWAVAKKDIYLALGKKLKIEKEIQFELSGTELKQKVRELCNTFPAFSYIYSNLNSRSYETGKYEGGCDGAVSCANGIQRGMKLSRFFSTILNNKDFDIEYSKITETNGVKETITISIDPVDYLLMSVNKSGWESCHKLHDFNGSGHSWGCYSAGTMSYMCDSCSLVGFKHSDKVYEYGINKVKFKEYSKNWREMIYYDINTNAFISCRQYPFTNDNVSKELRSMFEETISNYFKINNLWNVKKDYGARFNNNVSDLHYNDVTHSNGSYRLCYPKDIEKETIHFDVGSYPICPICGEDTLDEAGMPMCSCCEEDL